MSLLLSDPSRTSTIRDSFERDFARRMSRVTKALKELLSSKAFGKTLTSNAFCPTGKGGGIDNSCAPKSHKLTDKSGKVVKVFHGTDKEISALKGEAIYFSPNPGYSYAWNSPHVIEAELEMKNPYHTEIQSEAEGIGYWPEFIAELKAQGYDGLIYSKKGDILKGATGWGNDYPQYVVFSPAQVKITGRYTNEEFRIGVQLGDITTNSRWAFEESQSKVDNFEVWLKAKLSEVLHEKDIHSGTDWWQIYIERAYKFGAARAFDQIHKKKSKPSEGMLGAKQFFMGTVPKERLKLLISRTYKGIEGLTETMRNQLTQELTDGLIQGLSYEEVGKRIDNKLGIGLNRAKTIARTEIVRAQAEGQLAALKALGVKQLGIQVEFHTAKEPCPKCRKYRNRILTVEEAEGLIPIHPNCKCAFVPYLTPNPSPQKAARRKALEASILATKSRKVGKNK